MLEFKNFTLEYENAEGKNLKILDDINLKFEKGSINVITGESGCGKTSLIKVIKEMKEDGKIIIIITHDYEFIKMAQENVIKFIK